MKAILLINGTSKSFDFDLNVDLNASKSDIDEQISKSVFDCLKLQNEFGTHKITIRSKKTNLILAKLTSAVN